MAKLSDLTLEQGRNFIRVKDLDGFMKWLDDNYIAIDRVMIRSTYKKLFLVGDTQRGLKMFDAIFPEIDPVADIRNFCIKLGFILLLIFGAIGGLVYLFKTIL